MTQSKRAYVPEGMHTITPHLVCAGALQAIEFYKQAFGATEALKLVAPNGLLIHAGLRIGDSMLMLAEECERNRGPKSLNGSPVTVHLQVDNVDAVFEKAVAAGATVLMPVADMFWGDRYGQLVDPFGHHWSIATHVRDVSPEEMQEAANECCAPK